MLKKRIFYADRIEKIEKVLLSLDMISKDGIYCSDHSLMQFKEQLDQEGTLEKIYELILNEKEEIWFDIYRSISSPKDQ